MITIYGASDDLVEVSGCEGADEFNVYGDDGKVHWRGDFVASDTTGEAGRLRVYAIYDGCWHFSVGMVDEGDHLPPWPFVIRQGKGMTPGARAGTERYESSYSVVLTVDAPAGTRLDNVWPKRDES